MKNKFCTIFLYMFAIDGILGIFQGGTTLLGSEISHGGLFLLFASIFGVVIVVCAIVQTIIGFVRKLRWSARIIGLYVILYTIISGISGFVHGAYYAAKGIDLAEIQSLLIKNPYVNIFGLVFGLLQILLFFWAFKDLSGGHYLQQDI